jgi:phospholipid/cholesterol/gamma-HCH transport system substrate-binding protein
MSAARARLLGLAFVTALASFVAFCIGTYNGVFTDRAVVQLRIEQAGLQLLTGSDVKLRGINVGTVEDISSDGSGATIELALQPDRLSDLPADVEARLVPKTLFGEKYVDLVVPPDAAEARLEDGDVIPEDRSAPTLELNRVLDDVVPVLRAVKPEQLNATLTALATALDGRGESLGQTLVEVDTYLRGINPQLPQLRRDLVALAEVADVYDRAAPDLLATVRNLLTTAGTVVEQEDLLGALLPEVTSAADSTRTMLADNERNLVRVNAVNRDLIGILKEYSPVFPCFFRGYGELSPRIDGAVGDTPETERFAHIVITFTQPVPAYEYPIDLPEYNERRGPDCFGLPDPPQPLHKETFADGTEDDPRFAEPAQAPGVRASAAVDALLAPTLGVPADEVPDIGNLLWTPLLSGTTVSLR